MLPSLFAQRLISATAVGVGGYLTKKAGESLASFAVNEAPKFEDPVLLVALPAAIVKETFIPIEKPDFECENRAQLHEHCTKASFFDRLTVPPVNNELHRRGIPLTKESLHALKRDMEHSSQMSFCDPVHKKISDYYEASINQEKIAESFTNAGEFEGAKMHKWISTLLYCRAKGYDELIAPLEGAVRKPGLGTLIE